MAPMLQPKAHGYVQVNLPSKCTQGIIRSSPWASRFCPLEIDQTEYDNPLYPIPKGASHGEGGPLIISQSFL